MRNVLLTDAEYVSMYKNGNDGAFSHLMQTSKARVYAAIYKIVKDRHLAEDLSQDVFIKASDTIRRGKYAEEGKFLPWVLRIAHNLAIDHFRKSKRTQVISIDDNEYVYNSTFFMEEDPESGQIKKENHQKLRLLIRQLPAEQKQVLIMRHFADMSFQEIAESTGVSINTALGRMRYALINLRKILDKNPYMIDQSCYA